MAINLRNVVFHYSDTPEKTVLNIPDWSVTHQEHVFIHGPSGYGKSTLLNLISGMLVPVAGELTVLGKRLDQMGQRQRDRFRAHHVGYVFQQFNLIPYLDVMENILLAHGFGGSKQTDIVERIYMLLARLNLSDDVWYKPVCKLSTGQQQRVAIARAIINKPELLIADEPTSSLDKENRDDFMSLLMTLVAEYDVTLLFVSHDMTLSQYFRRVQALSDINQSGGS